jgi:hypothetical protein
MKVWCEGLQLFLDLHLSHRQVAFQLEGGPEDGGARWVMLRHLLGEEVLPTQQHIHVLGGLERQHKRRWSGRDMCAWAARLHRQQGKRIMGSTRQHVCAELQCGNDAALGRCGVIAKLLPDVFYPTAPYNHSVRSVVERAYGAREVADDVEDAQPVRLDLGLQLPVVKLYRRQLFYNRRECEIGIARCAGDRWAAEQTAACAEAPRVSGMSLICMIYIGVKRSCCHYGQSGARAGKADVHVHTISRKSTRGQRTHARTKAR